MWHNLEILVVLGLKKNWNDPDLVLPNLDATHSGAFIPFVTTKQYFLYLSQNFHHAPSPVVVDLGRPRCREKNNSL